MIPSTKKYETNRLTSIIPSSTSYLFVAFITFTLDGLFFLILETFDRIIGSSLSRFFLDDVSIILWKMFKNYYCSIITANEKQFLSIYTYIGDFYFIRFNYKCTRVCTYFYSMKYIIICFRYVEIYFIYTFTLYFLFLHFFFLFFFFFEIFFFF